MSRIVNRPVIVKTDSCGRPVSFKDGPFHYQVREIIDWWREAGKWWEGEPERAIYRVITEDLFVYDLEHSGKQWLIYRVWD